MHQTWTSVEICQIVIIFCSHCIHTLHSLVQLFELVITTYIYWPIECPSRASFVRMFEVARIDVCPLTIRVHSKSSFNMGCWNLQELVLHLLITEMQPKSCTCRYMCSKWAINNTLELPKKFNTQRLIVDVMQENINHMIQTMQFTYGHFVSINSYNIILFLQQNLYVSKCTF
jgi:hypothetical protein